MKNKLLLLFVRKYGLHEIDPSFLLDGINSCLEDFVCDDWLTRYLHDLQQGLRFHALKMRIKDSDTEIFEDLCKTYAIKIFNVYCYDDINQIFLTPETDDKTPSFSLSDSGIWCDWAIRNRENLRKRYGRG